MTLDTDVALAEHPNLQGPELRQRLKDQGFAEELLGDDRPPATHYRLSEADGFYAEFLTPLSGGDYTRQGRRKATREIGGVVSQQLRYIEILLAHPWSVQLPKPARAATVQIANPVSFIAQKLLIHGKRDREDRAKDILYLHDTLEVFAPQLEALRDLWRHTIKPTLRSRQPSLIENSPETLFSSTSDDLRRAARISPERGLSPEDIRGACFEGLALLFTRS